MELTKAYLVEMRSWKEKKGMEVKKCHHVGITPNMEVAQALMMAKFIFLGKLKGFIAPRDNNVFYWVDAQGNDKVSNFDNLYDHLAVLNELPAELTTIERDCVKYHSRHQYTDEQGRQQIKHWGFKLKICEINYFGDVETIFAEAQTWLPKVAQKLEKKLAMINERKQQVRMAILEEQKDLAGATADPQQMWNRSSMADPRMHHRSEMADPRMHHRSEMADPKTTEDRQRNGRRRQMADPRTQVSPRRPSSPRW